MNNSTTPLSIMNKGDLFSIGNIICEINNYKGGVYFESQDNFDISDILKEG